MTPNASLVRLLNSSRKYYFHTLMPSPCFNFHLSLLKVNIKKWCPPNVWFYGVILDPPTPLKLDIIYECSGNYLPWVSKYLTMNIEQSKLKCLIGSGSKKIVVLRQKKRWLRLFFIFLANFPNEIAPYVYWIYKNILWLRLF